MLITVANRDMTFFPRLAYAAKVRPLRIDDNLHQSTGRDLTLRAQATPITASSSW